MLRDEAGVNNAIDKVVDLQNHGVVDGGCGHPRDDQLIEGTVHARNRLIAVLSPHNQLAQKRIVVGRHLGMPGSLIPLLLAAFANIKL